MLRRGIQVIEKAQFEIPSLEALKAGNPEALASLVDTFSPHIYRLALRMLGNEQDAEDVLQETFIKAIRSLPEFEGRSSLSTWLHRIAVNEALMLIRKRKTNVVSIDEHDTDDDSDEKMPLQISDWCCLPEQEFTSAEARHHLDEAVQRLPEALRVVFILRDVEGMSIKETAGALNLSEANVKVRLFRARLKLREELTAYFSERLSEGSSE